MFEGFSLHREMVYLVEAGATPWKALASATTIPGQFLGQRYGVEPGDIANLVVLSRDPIAQIENTQSIQHVIVHGKIAF